MGIGSLVLIILMLVYLVFDFRKKHKYIKAIKTAEDFTGYAKGLGYMCTGRAPMHGCYDCGGAFIFFNERLLLCLTTIGNMVDSVSAWNLKDFKESWTCNTVVDKHDEAVILKISDGHYKILKSASELIHELLSSASH